MLEMIWQLQTRPLTDEAVARPLLEALIEVPGFQPERYDLNQRGQWRPFELDRAVVDLLTQRTQFMALAGGEDRLATIATGKHGEPPTLGLRWPGDLSSPTMDAWIETIVHRFYELTLVRLLVTSPRWRQALADAAITAPAEAGPLFLWSAWRVEEAPAHLPVPPRPTPTNLVRLERFPGAVLLRLAAEPAIASDEHAETLRRLAAAL